MMNEYAVTFNAQHEKLLGIIHQTAEPSDIGVLVVVGGPQYRVGSHRQFIQLARAISAAGYHCFRFDYRGMGDSEGAKVEFDQIDLDIKSAIDAFMAHQPTIKKVVIWGLCDAASAALIYAHQDERVKGLVLLNPWLRSEQAMGKAMLKFYYVQRLLSKDFWQKLLKGKVKVTESISDVKSFTQDSLLESKGAPAESYQNRMLNGFNQFDGNMCIILSENDLVAREFNEQVNSQKEWKKIRSNLCEVHEIKGADHTFSSQLWKKEVEKTTIEFIYKHLRRI